MPNRPDRNHAIERLLRDANALSSPVADGRCVQAEELAAWLDGGLSETEAARVELHVASCPACQALLGAYAASAPDAPASRVTSLTRAMLPFAAAAVLVAGVWLGTRRAEPPPVAAPAERQMARLDDVAVPPSTTAPPAAAPTQTAGEQAQAQYRSPASAGTPAAPSRKDEGALERAAERAAAPAELRRVSAQPPATPAQPATATANVAETDVARVQARPEPSVPSLERSSADDLSAGSARSASALISKASDARVPVASPDGASRWRIVGAALEVSADAGATWLPAAGVTPAELADVTSGASPARGVSWLVGRGGLVLVTVDGRRFTRAAPPAATLLTAVRAVDGTAAEVRAADGRAWRTTDAGRTWMPVR